jgi:ABC-type metal ion transport system substrate-binding protein
MYIRKDNRSYPNVIAARFSNKHAKEIEKLAKSYKLSVAQIIRDAVSDYLEREGR